jgi:vitamin B12/bleomycin/antimicrobial peptide transport system ATP-binding/permease protein
MSGTPEAAPGTRTSHLGLLRRLAQLAKAFFITGNRRETRVLVFAMLSLCLTVGVVQVFVSYAGRNFITSLAQRDPAGFYRNLWIYLSAFALAVPVGVFYRYTAERLSLLWRQWMTHLLVKRYFFNRAYYRLRSSNRVDNPDQRISEDVKSFTTGVLGYLLTAINSVVTLFAFFGVLWMISWKLPVGLAIFATVGTGLSILIGKRLVGLHFKQYQKEADFRYSLIRIRDNAESIAFFRGEKREHRDLVVRFAEVITNTMWIIGWNRTLGFFTNSYNYVALIIPTLIVGPMFIQGAVEFGVVTQAESAFAQVLMALSVIVAQFDGLSAFAAGIKRLGDLWDELDDFDAEDALMEKDNQLVVDEGAPMLKMTDLTVQTPGSDKTLTRKLNFTLPPGKSVLIMGASGTGKSSLLRTIAGLWQSGEGSIERPKLNNLIFLSQRPYMVLGNLREQLVYPQSEEGADDQLIRDALEKVNFTEVLDRVDGDFGRSIDWTNILSLGEQQRISFARIFLRKPVLAFLDEATSSLDEANERILYQRLCELGISFVSVGHRSTLKEFHDHLITLNKDGTVEISNIPK